MLRETLREIAPPRALECPDFGVSPRNAGLVVPARPADFGALAMQRAAAGDRDGTSYGT